MATPKGPMGHIFMAVCEWFLMFWMFVDAALAYSLTKFAKRCQLQIPCFFCSRLDHFFRTEECGSYPYVNLFCEKHQTDIAYLIYCNLHNQLVDAREMCESCFNSATLQNGSSLHSASVSCSCCKRRLKEKSTGQRSPIQTKTFGSKTSTKVTTKPPLPRVNRPGRSKRSRNKTKNLRKDAPYIGYPELKFNSDSEFEFLFSDKENGFKNDKIFRRHSYSTPDLRPAFSLDAQLNRTSRTRSASLTPSSLYQQKSGGFDPLRIMKYKNPLSHFSNDSLNNTDGNESLDGSMVACSSGSQNRYNIFSRNSFSASDLGSAVFLEMHSNNRTRRAASLTPNSGQNFREHKWPKDVFVPAETKKNKNPSISSSSSNVETGFPTTYGYGYLDDLVTLKNTNRRNRSNIPRRHSYSVFQLGGDILLNMPNDESLTNCSAYLAPNKQNGENDYKQLSENFSASDLSTAYFDRSRAYLAPNIQKGENENDYKQLPVNFSASDFSTAFFDKSRAYLSVDDSAVSRTLGNQYQHQNNLPRRHSYSVFQLGGDILLNMPNDEDLTGGSAPLAQNPSAGYDFSKPKNTKFSRKKGRRNKKAFPSLDKVNRYGSRDDFLGSSNTGSHNNDEYLRRHSYSAFELGCSLLLNMTPINENANYLPKFDSVNESHEMQFPLQNVHNVYGSLDDSAVLPKKGTQKHNQNHENVPRRHSFSVYQLGGDILLNMPIDETFTDCSESFSPNEKSNEKSTLQNDEKDQTVPKMGYFRSDEVIDKTKWHGSYDDYLISRSSGNRSEYQSQRQSQSQSQSNIARRHSHSAVDLGRALLVEIQLEKNLKNQQNRAHQNSKRDKKLLPPLIPMHVLGSSPDVLTVSCEKSRGNQSLEESVFAESISTQNRNGDPRRHSYTAFELGCAVLLNLQREKSLTKRSASLTPNLQTNRSQDITDRKRSENLTRSCYSASDLTDLTSLSLLQMDESATMNPNSSINQSFGELNSLKFETGPSSSLQKRKKGDRLKAKKGKKSVTQNVKVKSSSPEYFDKSDESGQSSYKSSQDQHNRYNVFSRNSQSASDLGSLQEESSKTRSKSLTPDYYSRSPYPEPVRKHEENVHMGVGRDIKNDLCASCLDKIDLRSLDGSEIDWDGGIERVKRKAEDDVRCMRLLQSELEAERNAATVAANHAMNMITRLQQEKASLQMEALQYLRMMEEQAEYDMEALQKANELVEEKENEIQDLLDELDQYKARYGDEYANNVKSLEDEKKYVFEALSALEKKINEFGKIQKTGHLDDENDSFLTLEREISDMQEMMKGLEADVDFVKHVCNTLRGNEGVEFIEEIAHQLHDLRKIMFDRSCVSSS